MPEAEHLHRARVLCQRIGERILIHIGQQAHVGEPTPNVYVLGVLATILRDHFPSLPAALVELAAIEGIAELRLEAAAVVRRAAESVPASAFGTYHAFARLLDPAHDEATLRMIRGAIG